MSNIGFIVVTPNEAARDKIYQVITASYPTLHKSHCFSLKGLEKYLTIHLSEADKYLAIYVDAAIYPKISECADHLVGLWVLESKMKKKFTLFVFSDDEERLMATGLPRTHLVHTKKTNVV